MLDPVGPWRRPGRLRKPSGAVRGEQDTSAGYRAEGHNHTGKAQRVSEGLLEETTLVSTP